MQTCIEYSFELSWKPHLAIVRSITSFSLSGAILEVVMVMSLSLSLRLHLGICRKSSDNARSISSSTDPNGGETLVVACGMLDSVDSFVFNV